MSINKNFVVKNGLEVASNLLIANNTTKKVGIGSTNPRADLDIRGKFIATDSYISGISTVISTLNVGQNGNTFTVLGVGGSVGVGTNLPAYLLDIRSPVSTGQTALYVQGDIKITGDLNVDDIKLDQADINSLNVSGIATLSFATGIGLNFVGINTLTNLTGTNLSYSGIGTVDSLRGTNLNYSGVGTVSRLAGSNLNYTGISTLTNLTGTNANYSGVSTFTNLRGTNLNYSGVGTVSNLTGTNINYTGISTLTNLTGTNLNYTGIATIGTLNATNVSISGAAATNFTVTQNLSVGGIATISRVVFNSGIVTASSGIVTYYGDGQYLTNVTRGIGIGTSGGIVGLGATILYFQGSGISTVTVSSGIGTINIIGGSGGASIGVGTLFVGIPTSGNLWYNTDLGRLFIYYNDGDSQQWVDASPFNVGIITSLSNVSFNAGSATAPSIYFTSDPSTGFFSPGLGQISFVSTGSSILNVNPSGVIVTGIATAQDFDSLSDINYKENINTVNNALLKVEQLRGVKFNWKESGLPSYGVIAQELEQVLPELVHGDDPKTVNYNGIIGVLIEAIKELKEEINTLKERIGE